jgi:hypothetical protein
MYIIHMYMYDYYVYKSFDTERERERERAYGFFVDTATTFIPQRLKQIAFSCGMFVLNILISHCFVGHIISLRRRVYFRFYFNNAS